MKMRVAFAVVAFVLAIGASQASALAVVWKDKGVTVTKSFSLGLTGGETAIVDAGEWITCDVHATLTSTGGSNGQITAWEQTNCDGGGLLAGCLFLPEAKSLPWALTLHASDLTVGNGAVKFTAMKLPCTLKSFSASVVGMELTPDSTTSIASFSFAAASEVSGSLQVDSPNSGTYGIG